MLCLKVEAPFAAFRRFGAGSFRPGTGFITPSAAYGLILNIGCIEMRLDDGKSPTTLIRKKLPECRLAVGALSFPREQDLFQQLHNYPVGDEKMEDPLEPGCKIGKKAEGKRRCKGSKYNISPVRRSFLSDFKALICIDGNRELEKDVASGLAGEKTGRYGLPFLGDNSFLPDKLLLLEELAEAWWYSTVEKNDDDVQKERIVRVTVSIDRMDMSRTKTVLYAPSKKKSREVPEKSWIEMGG